MANEVNQSGGEVKAFWININELSQRLKKCTFLPIPCGEGTWLEDFIVQNGGDVIGDDGINAEYTITILDEKYFNDNPGEDYQLPSDCFSSLFIYDIVKAVGKGDKELPNLNEYRLTETNFVDVDVNKILFQEKKWTDFTLIPAPVAYSKLTTQEVVEAWKSNDQITCDSSIDEGNIDLDQDQEQSIISHYKLNVEDSPNSYTICFETSMTVEQVKQKFASICDIPMNLQHWSGWPEKVTDETPLSACFKNQVEHSLKLSRRALIKSGPSKEVVDSRQDKTNHNPSGKIPEQDPLAIRVPVPTTETERTSVATPPRTPTTNGQQRVQVASPGRGSGNTSGRRSVTTSKHAPLVLNEKAPVDSSKRNLFTAPGQISHTSSQGRAPGTTPERGPGNTPKRAHVPTSGRANNTTPERADVAPPDSVALASPVPGPNKDLKNLSASCSVKVYPKRRFIVESSSSSSSTISCEIASPVKRKVTPSKRIRDRRSTSKDMSSDSETGVDENKKKGQPNERSRSKSKTVTDKTKGPISGNPSISSQASRSKKQMNSDNKGGSVHDRQEKRRKSQSLNITDDSETDNERDFKLTNKSKLAPPDTADSNTKKKETSIAKIARLVPIAVAGPSGYQNKSEATKKQRAAVSSESELDDLSETEGPVVKTEGKQCKAYPVQEGQRILDLICKHNAFLYTSGNNLWKQIEASKLFPGRTFCSLRDHYLKKVKKLVQNKKDRTYKISPEDLKRLLKANERVGWKKHSNMCPDYNFNE